MLIKARQEDYWNKIAQYNFKIHQLEVKETEERKKREQENMRKLLFDQVQMYREKRKSDKDADLSYMDNVNKRNDAESIKEQQALIEKRKKLQALNVERGDHQKTLFDRYNEEKKNLKQYQTEKIKEIQA